MKNAYLFTISLVILLFTACSQHADHSADAGEQQTKTQQIWKH